MRTGMSTGRFSGSVMVDADENVAPSFPSQPNVNESGARGPPVRVRVIVRVPVSPAAHPSRSKIPTPMCGSASKWLVA
jgi:hypothetical protein